MSEELSSSVPSTTARLPPRWLLKLFTKINVVVYKLSAGRLMNKLSGMPILLVEMTGVKSGRTRTIPLMYVPNGEGFALVASQGGAPSHPVWYHNLVDKPNIRITYAGQTKEMTVREVFDEEKAEIWETCCQYYPPYQAYQDRTERRIPVFVCE
ncbi:nitroreductase family deazaflavin-dependent oxidoreductase [Pseudomonadales bacterium]|nr:nitroreductase family deazaflavin-dependent oxidoreductase [Pseudomonadales bacterium]MDG1907992.1 nitroreductase family deazaflavin-dependent oxidoreductase [Pseudomonadales bacterium]|tara:strand:- start:2534 stop:2995 length:462 start_codon:yes stop_codon:yes gene_type:complete